jgi:hypothetical protein
MSNDDAIVPVDVVEVPSFSGDGHDTLEPWLQLPDEPNDAYHAFTIYRDVAPPLRSYDYVDDVLHGRDDHPDGFAIPRDDGTSKRQITKWNRNYNWDARVRAFDAHIERLKLNDESRRALREYGERQRKYAIAAQESAYRILKIVNDRLDKILKNEEEIPPRFIPSYIKATVSLIDLAANSEAQSIGVNELLDLLETDE